MESANEIHTGHSPVHPIHPQKLWHGILKVIRILAIPETLDWKEETIMRILNEYYSSQVQSWNLLYLAMNPACWSRRREVGAFLGIIASFTRTAMVPSTLKNAESFKDTSHPVLSIHPRHLSHPRQIEVIPLISKLEPETSLSLHVPCPLPSVSSVTPLKTNIICKCRR